MADVTNVNNVDDILRASSAQSFEKGLAEQNAMMQRQQDFFTQQYIDMNVQYQSVQQQQASLNAQVLQSYFPYTQEGSLAASAFEAGIPMVTGGLAGKFAMNRRGSLFSGVTTAAAVGGLTYAGVTPAIEFMRGSTDSITAPGDLARLQSSGRMNAYMSMSNWASQGGRAYAPESFATEFEEPIKQYADMLHVAPEQLAPGVADLVSQGIVAGTGQRGRGMSDVLKEATVIFKSLESFFGSVDINALRGKIQQMQAAGFTSESMAQAAGAMQASIFSLAPEGIRNQITAKAVQAGGEYADMGFAPGLGAEMFITNYESAYRQFGQMDEYNQFRFRTPSRMAGIQQQATSNYMNQAGFFSVVGGGDFMEGINKITNKFDMATPQGMRDYERYRFEKTMNMGAGDVNRSITAQARELSDIYGTDLESGLEMILGSRDAATAFLVSAKDREQRVSDIAAITQDFGIRSGDLSTVANITRGALGEIRGSSLSAAAVQMAESQMRGGVEGSRLQETAILGGYFDPQRALSEFSAAGKAGMQRGKQFLFTGEYTAEFKNAIGEQAQLLSGVTKGIQSVDATGGKLEDDVESAISELIWNPRAKMVMLRGATTGDVVDRETLARELESAGAGQAASLIMAGSGEKLGQLYKGLQERGYSDHTRLLNQTLFGGVDISGNFESLITGSSLFRKTETSGYAKTANTVGNWFLGVSTGATVVGAAAAGATFVAPVLAPVTGAVAAGAGTVAMVSGVLGGIAKGGGMIYESLLGDSISATEAMQMDQDAWGGELVINSIAALFVSMKSLPGSLFSFKETEKTNFITTAGNAIYGTLYNEVYINKSNASDEELISMVADNIKTTSYEVGQDVITHLTEGPGRMKLRNVVSVVINYLRKEKTPIDMRTFTNRFAIRAEQMAGDITNKDIKDIKYLSEKIGTGEYVQMATARTSGTTREQLEVAAKTLGTVNTELKDRFGLKGSATTLSRELASIITATDESGQPLSETQKIRKVSDIIAKSGDELKEGTSIKQLLQVTGDVFQGLSTQMKNSAEIAERATGIKSLFANLANDDDFKSSIQRIFKVAATGTNLV